MRFASMYTACPPTGLTIGTPASSSSAPGGPAVGRESLDQDQEIGDLLGPLGVVEREESADVHEPVLLGAHGAAVAGREHLARDLGHRPAGVAGLALLDEPAVLGEAAGVEDERHAMALAHLAHRADVGHRDRLAAPGVVGDSEDHHPALPPPALPPPAHPG